MDSSTDNKQSKKASTQKASAGQTPRHTREELLEMHPKDLIKMLDDRHIDHTTAIEKDDLVDLLMERQKHQLYCTCSKVNECTMASHPSHRQSVLDPALEGIRRYRSPSSSRVVSTSVTYAPSPLSPPPPSAPIPSSMTSPIQIEYSSRPFLPPRSTTPLPMPPKTPPPLVKSPSMSSLVSLPITLPASPPPTPRPKDRKRSTSSSVVTSQSNQPFVPAPPTPNLVRPHTYSRTTLPAGIAHEPGYEHSYNFKQQDFEEHNNHSQEHLMGQGLDSRRTTLYYSDEGSYNRHLEQESRELQREQSERVSRMMGQRMLQGWTMLQDICPNPSCGGIPLMRSREKKEMCVACGKCPAEHGERQTRGQGPASLIAYPLSPPSSTITSPRTSVAMSPPMGASTTPQHKTSRVPRDLSGRVSSSIVLPPPQRTSRHLSSDLDKLASEDEDLNGYIQLVGHANEFTSRSLPPVPPVPAIHSMATPTPSRPTSTYSNSSGYSPSDKERPSPRTQRHPSPQNHHFSKSSIALTTPSIQAPLSPEEEAVVAATLKTISVLLVKLETYRAAFEASDNPKESQVLANHIRGTMECLKACRQVL
ncbi:hypothetical protein FBU30_002761 [Linnemannia zychae]|nr:hypothetical protein FBU30_002761 [Linnemannia zychae]